MDTMPAPRLLSPSPPPPSHLPHALPHAHLDACPPLTRSVSAASSASLSLTSPSTVGRSSFGSSVSTSTAAESSSSRSSSASYDRGGTQSKRRSGDRPSRRGYVRPQGTGFAASAQARESVLSLGSIAHLQYYFARTGLLDGKGGRLHMRKAGERMKTADLARLDTACLGVAAPADVDSLYGGSAGVSPLLPVTHIVESPLQEGEDDFTGEDHEVHPHMLPPTVSTYNHREKHVERPRTLEELKGDLHKALEEADKALEQVSHAADNEIEAEGDAADRQGWYELQGMHILDIMTLAIRAAKMYYTAHDQPARFSAIKSERKVRTELLGVMDVLKRMAARSFAGGMRADERETMEIWVDGVHTMLKQEAELEAADQAKRASWTWMDPEPWLSRRPEEREYAFLRAMDPDADTLPPLTLMADMGTATATANDNDAAAPSPPPLLLPTPLLADLRTGVRLVRLHNALVRASKRPFGAIGTFHTDVGKPYRCAENLRYWLKAAELRWEVVLRVDVAGVVAAGGTGGADPAAAWRGFEAALWTWCARVREELVAELR